MVVGRRIFLRRSGGGWSLGCWLVGFCGGGLRGWRLFLELRQTLYPNGLIVVWIQGSLWTTRSRLVETTRPVLLLLPQGIQNMCEQRRSAIAAIFAKGVARCRTVSRDEHRQPVREPEFDSVLAKPNDETDATSACNGSVIEETEDLALKEATL